MMSYEWHFLVYLPPKVHRELCLVRDKQKGFRKNTYNLQ